MIICNQQHVHLVTGVVQAPQSDHASQRQSTQMLWSHLQRQWKANKCFSKWNQGQWTKKMQVQQTLGKRSLPYQCQFAGCLQNHKQMRSWSCKHDKVVFAFKFTPGHTCSAHGSNISRAVLQALRRRVESICSNLSHVSPCNLLCKTLCHTSWSLKFFDFAKSKTQLH